MKGFLILEDGSCFEGLLFGDTTKSESFGEAVFNTAMAGYEEVLTDPSYRGQIVVMTYPHQGNYGITTEDGESGAIHVAGFVVRELTLEPSSWRAKLSLSQALGKAGITGISGVDTRQITLALRRQGAMRGAIFKAVPSLTGKKLERWIASMVAKVRASATMEGLALADKVSVKSATPFSNSQLTTRISASGAPGAESSAIGHDSRLRVAVWDFGVKQSILRNLENLGYAVTLFPYQSKADEILSTNPQGIVLSNGPGDPAVLGHAIGEIKALIHKNKKPPILGICLGHQLLGIACGGKTYKMRFGHHGVNHPVKNIQSSRVWISSHNHGFAVAPESLPSGVEPTYTSLNDQTLEGMASRELGFFSVQFHPEAAPGPTEAAGIFKQFAQEMAG